MSYDEKTAEIEIPTLTAKDNIVHLRFGKDGDRRNAARRMAAADATPAPADPAGFWVSDFDLKSPWVLRLLAVVFVLILSMLIL